MYGHIKTMAEAVEKGVEKAGGTADVFQFVES
jgi:multimeric flavodoxin WrbA